jgi:alkylated DNA repair dioxygenase AlkB
MGPTKRKNAKGTKSDVLKVLLEHGDIVIMHGREIQKYYEVRQHSSLYKTFTDIL